MQSKAIYYISEETHLATYWYNQMLSALESQALYREHTLISLPEGKLSTLSPQVSPVVVIGATHGWIDHITALLLSMGIQAVLLGVGSHIRKPGISVLALDHRSGACRAVLYLHEAGRRRIAFLAYNDRSASDSQKRQGMLETCAALGLSFSEADIFPLENSIEDCLTAFCARCAEYDAVICANDVSALALLGYAPLRAKARVPEDLFVIGFGCTVMSHLISPTLTSVSLDYAELGKYAVDHVIHLRRNPLGASWQVLLQPHLQVGQSTALRPALPPAPLPDQTPVDRHSIFYKDTLTRATLQAEQFFCGLQDIDWHILLDLLKGVRKADTQARLYIADSTYKYRMRRMLTLAGCARREELAEKFGALVDLSAMEAYTRHAPLNPPAPAHRLP